MKHHLMVFVENKPGKLEKVTQILADNNINIKFISVSSLGEFGIIKIIVDDTDKGLKVLKKENFTVSKRNILVSVLQDKPGELHKLLKFLSARNINLDDCYGYPLQQKDKIAMVIESDKYPEIKNILADHGYEIL
ncbi:MAG: ACT domain-containing protein [Candidatus Margulisbacteria bacterium]|nr:ACT domain-containing protein [Candidatus Margulisiibacteriota bacterium]